MGIELRQGETSLGSWTVYHEPPGRRPVTGKLEITNQRIMFEAQMEAGGRGLKQARQMLSGDWKSSNSIAIDRSEVTSVDSRKSLLSKRVIVSTGGGSTHAFNRGMMSVDPIMAALGRG